MINLNWSMKSVPFVSPAISNNTCEIDRQIFGSRVISIFGIGIISSIALGILTEYFVADTVFATIIPAEILILVIVTPFSLGMLDRFLTVRAINHLAVKKFMEAKHQVSFDALQWILNQPEPLKLLLEEPSVDLTKQVFRYSNIFQGALREGSREACDLIWGKMSFKNRIQVLKMSGKNEEILESDENEFSLRITKFQKIALEEQKKNCIQFIFGMNALAEEHSLPRLPNEIKAMILNLHQECLLLLCSEFKRLK